MRRLLGRKGIKPTMTTVQPSATVVGHPLIQAAIAAAQIAVPDPRAYEYIVGAVHHPATTYVSECWVIVYGMPTTADNVIQFSRYYFRTHDNGNVVWMQTGGNAEPIRYTHASGNAAIHQTPLFYTDEELRVLQQHLGQADPIVSTAIPEITPVPAEEIAGGAERQEPIIVNNILYTPVSDTLEIVLSAYGVSHTFSYHYDEARQVYRIEAPGPDVTFYSTPHGGRVSVATPNVIHQTWRNRIPGLRGRQWPRNWRFDQPYAESPPVQTSAIIPQDDVVLQSPNLYSGISAGGAERQDSVTINSVACRWMDDGAELVTIRLLIHIAGTSATIPVQYIGDIVSHTYTRHADQEATTTYVEAGRHINVHAPDMIPYELVGQWGNDLVSGIANPWPYISR